MTTHDPDCIFCRIIAGNAEASVVAEDGDAIAIVDIAPLASAHVLVMPKRHVATIDALPDDLAGPLMAMVARVARAIRAADAPEGISVWQANGKAAGQEVFHLHFHVISRAKGDGLSPRIPKHLATWTRADLDARAADLRAAMSDAQ